MGMEGRPWQSRGAETGRPRPLGVGFAVMAGFGLALRVCWKPLGVRRRCSAQAGQGSAKALRAGRPVTRARGGTAGCPGLG